MTNPSSQLSAQEKKLDSHYQMINVGHKAITHRIAVAEGCIQVNKEVFIHIKNRSLPKGDVLVLAEIAGIMGAKKTADMIPLCHPIGLDKVQLKIHLDEDNYQIHVYCITTIHAKTGVEMEALAGVNAALLTIYDLSKMFSHDLTLLNTRLLYKQGGKSGQWIHPNGLPAWLEEFLSLNNNSLNHQVTGDKHD